MRRTGLWQLDRTLPQQHYGGITCPLAARDLRHHAGTVTDHVFATTDGRSLQLFVLGDEVRCIAQGREGDFVTGSIVPVHPADGTATAPISPPIMVTIGAVVPWQLVLRR